MAVAAAYHHVHPAVLHEISRIIRFATEAKLPLSLCGEMAADPVAVLLLAGLGVRNLSMSASRLPRIKWLLRSISIDQARRCSDAALALDNSDAIRALAEAKLKDLGLGRLLHNE